MPVANVVGEVAFRVPDAGVYYHFAMSGTGRILLIVVPALLTLRAEVRALRPRARSRQTVFRRGLCATAIALAGSVALAAPAAGIFTSPAVLGSNQFVTGQLNAPTLTSATPGSAGLLKCKVTLGWSPPATGIAPAGYDVYRSTTSGGPYSLVASVGNVTAHVDSGLAQNTTYHYVLKSSRASWQNSNSNLQSARTPLPCL